MGISQISLDGITLPIDLIWSDEYGWSNVSQNIKKSLTGSLIIQEATQPKGRLITLKGDPRSAWIDRTIADLIQAKVDTPDLDMVLNFHGDLYNVRFIRQGNKSPFITKEIYELANPDGEHVYSFSITLIEVAV